MTPQEILYMNELTKDRAESASMLEKPSMRGIKNSVVEKYSDQAHFIYELLQNADDANATEADFSLGQEWLVFRHNGTRHFSVSNPAEEDKATAEGTLGDINAITSIANSNKTSASIGKFGVGFKAVFQYTATPYIFDPCFCFRIERFIVPALMDEDFPGRKPDETVFVFPFDHPTRSAEEAYSDISDKLNHLVFPQLFLTRLKEIRFEFGETKGQYKKTIEQSLQIGDILAEHICLSHSLGIDVQEQRLWLFTRTDADQYRYSVGFFQDHTGHLAPVQEPAFCFFPTKEVTNLNFIVHAPFLLTDSREGIRAGIPHNDKMLLELAVLAGDALVCLRDLGKESGIPLIDDQLLSIIPVDSTAYSRISDKRKVSFLPFYTEIHNKMQHEALLPTRTDFTDSKNAYWADMPQLTQLFSDSQLALITCNENAHWVFPSIGRTEVQRNNKALFSYLESITRTNLNEDAILTGRTKGYYYDDRWNRVQSEAIQGINADFIEKQPVSWLYQLYKWIGETKHRTSIISRVPIFLDSDNKAAAAFDKENHLILFLPTEHVTGYRVVNPALLEDTDTFTFLTKTVGITQPALKDQIYNIILPLYADGLDVEPAAHFKLFFRYYLECPTAEHHDYINQLKKYAFLYYRSEESTGLQLGKAESMYLPTKEVESFLSSKASTRFLALEFYRSLVDTENLKMLDTFFTELGVKQRISIIECTVNAYEATKRKLPRPRSTRGYAWYEYVIDGGSEILSAIVADNSTEKSILLWNYLLSVITRDGSLKELRGECHYFYRNPLYTVFETTEVVNLKHTPWLFNRSGILESADTLNSNTISDIYDTASKSAKILLEFLNIEEIPEIPIDAFLNSLTETQRSHVMLARKLSAAGITSDEDITEFLEYRKKKAAKKDASQKRTVVADDTDDSVSTSTDITTEGTQDTEDTSENKNDAENDEVLVAPGNRKLSRSTSRVLKDIMSRTKDTPAPVHEFAPEKGNSVKATKAADHTTHEEVNDFADDSLDIDSDEFTQPAVDYASRIEQAKQKSAEEIDKIAYLEDIQTKAQQSPRYSYGWFRQLLELECLNNNESSSNDRQVTISFGKAELEPGTNRTLILRYPSRYIPQFMEDLADIPLKLHSGNQVKTVAIEVANIRSYTLRVKLKSSASIEGVDLSSVTSAIISAKSPAFLLEELKNQFTEFGFDDNFNMQQNLCENIDFIFGPPGTGKTTYLASKVLIPFMQQLTECRVLVLTPTNKSADVLVRRIMEVSGEDHSYESWLTRFGTTADESIEQSVIFRDKTFDIRKQEKSVTVTTIARFPYDYFMPTGTRLYLRDLNWDYIVIDEASMIPIANIIYPLYKKTPQKFIIAGDPFQIEPITSVDLWKDENIYTMVNLHSFAHPTTIPHNYHVKSLTTQYRSIPDIGSIFSKFAYDGILSHYRSAESQRPLNLDPSLGIKTLNVIKFPVSKYESIYRCKRLQHSSSYQVYSALFTYEYVCWLSRLLAEKNPGGLFRIGIIAPYRAQSDMIDKLLAAESLPKEVDVQVGTIHGFQGDECDIIFTVFNTPPRISASQNMFLNKRNIINVSISRARDYLFVIMPDDSTDNIENLKLVRRVEKLIHETGNYAEFLSQELEEEMFGERDYLENNTFSTSHQSVNVYGLPEKVYEIRTEDEAVDIQVHKPSK